MLASSLTGVLTSKWMEKRLRDSQMMVRYVKIRTSAHLHVHEVLYLQLDAFPTV